MTLRVSLEIAKQVSICSPAFEEIVKYYTDNNIESATVEEMIAHWKSMGRRDWALWLYAHVPEFERLVGQQSTQEELSLFEQDKMALEKQDAFYYEFNGKRFETKELADIERLAHIDKLNAQSKSLLVCNIESFHENSDSTWDVLDIDTYVPTDSLNHKIQVFNPSTGVYTVYDNLQDAVARRNQLYAEMVAINENIYVALVKYHPDFPNQTEVTVLKP